jgi:sugar phosphate isomerase/epimerase
LAQFLSVFPKCYFDDLYSRRRDYLDWLRQAATLGAEGVEHYDGFFASLDEAGVAPVRKTLDETGQISSLMCFSPNFTHPNPGERAHQLERRKTAIERLR